LPAPGWKPCPLSPLGDLGEGGGWYAPLEACLLAQHWGYGTLLRAWLGTQVRGGRWGHGAGSMAREGFGRVRKAGGAGRKSRHQTWWCNCPVLAVYVACHHVQGTTFHPVSLLSVLLPPLRLSSPCPSLHHCC
jgi:hypothetical protein